MARYSHKWNRADDDGWEFFDNGELMEERADAVVARLNEQNERIKALLQTQVIPPSPIIAEQAETIRKQTAEIGRLRQALDDLRFEKANHRRRIEVDLSDCRHCPLLHDEYALCAATADPETRSCKKCWGSNSPDYCPLREGPVVVVAKGEAK